jgi:hypothetical protein
MMWPTWRLDLPMLMTFLIPVLLMGWAIFRLFTRHPRGGPPVPAARG